MGFMIATSECIGCGGLFSYNPELVPSIRLNENREPDPNGKREPICRNCVERVNPVRVSRGLKPIEIVPGAYEPNEC